jgi:hypothetical protein
VPIARPQTIGEASPRSDDDVVSQRHGDEVAAGGPPQVLLHLAEAMATSVPAPMGRRGISTIRRCAWCCFTHCPWTGGCGMPQGRASAVPSLRRCTGSVNRSATGPLPSWSTVEVMSCWSLATRSAARALSRSPAPPPDRSVASSLWVRRRGVDLMTGVRAFYDRRDHAEFLGSWSGAGPAGVKPQKRTPTCRRCFVASRPR